MEIYNLMVLVFNVQLSVDVTKISMPILVNTCCVFCHDIGIFGFGHFVILELLSASCILKY